MNRIVKFAAPAALVFAAFGASASEGNLPSAGGQYTGPAVSVSAPALAAPAHEAFVPVGGGQFKASVEAPVRSASQLSPVDQRALTVGA
jgi:hypothetical protein